MRRLGEALGALVIVLLVGSQLGLYAGGVSYRKDCVTETAEVKKDWTFTWFAPVPYLFRPSEPGCSVHTGTRVALDAIGLFTFTDADDALADDLAESSGSGAGAGEAYWGGVNLALREYAAKNGSAKSMASAFDAIEETRTAVKALVPPAKFADLHDRLVDLLSAQLANGHRLAGAVTASDQKALNAAKRESLDHAARFDDLVDEFNSVHEAG